jgi:hydrogenase expression/formation protein HypC
MCIGVPMKVVTADGLSAVCEGMGQRQTVDLSLVGEQAEGIWVLVFLGAAREVLTNENARQISDALQGLQLALSGADNSAIDAMFSDLIDREPQLPEFLKDTDKVEQ